MTKEIKAALIGGVAALIAALLAVVLPPLFKKEKIDPHFIISNPFLNSNDAIVIIADNIEANINKPIHIKFDTILYAQQGLPIKKANGKQRWSFSLVKNSYTPEMVTDGEHEIRVAFEGNKLSDPMTVVFNIKPHFIDNKASIEIKKTTPKSQSSTGESIITTKIRKKVLLEGRRVCNGNVLGLTILVQFKDEQLIINKKDVDAMMNGDNYTANNNWGSVRKYFSSVSNSKLNFSNRVVGPITLSHNRNYYENKLFVKEALDIVVNDLKIDLSDFDSKKEGIVDAITFLYAGRSVYAGNLWPHNSSAKHIFGTVKTNYYAIAGAGKQTEDLSIGTHIHNFAHMLCRFPDMYDSGNRDGDNEKSQGLGRYDLMASGNHLDRGRNPGPISACLRDLVGWHDKEVLLNIPGTYEAEHGNYGIIYKYKTRNKNEYFVIENRSNLGLDKYLPSSGLGIYHCDTFGSNEWQTGTTDHHYKVALLQADGHLDLEQNRNSGDNTDLWGNTDGIALSNNTIPSSRMWDGSDSGLTVSDIGKPGKIIKFTVGPSQ